MSITPWIAVGIGSIISLCITIFWIKMLTDCATKEPSQGNDKVIWILIIALGTWLGALLYYLVRRPKRIEEIGH